MSNPIAKEVLQGFLEEARGYLPGIQQQLERIWAQPGDDEAHRELHRLIHNVRGASNVVGLTEAGQLAEGIEDLLDQIASGEIAFDAEVAELLNQGIQQIREMLTGSAPAPKPAPAAKASALSDFAGELLDGFLLEAEEHLQTVVSCLGQMEQNPDDQPLIQEVRRGIHTIKGAAGMVGLPVMSSVAHRMEDLLDRLYEGTAVRDSQSRELLVSTYDLLAEMVDQRGKETGLEPRIEQLLARYDAVLDNSAVEEAAAPPPMETQDAETPSDPEAGAGRFVRVPLERLDELVRLVGELFVQRSFFEQQLTYYSREVGELSLSLQRLRRISSTLETEHAVFHSGVAAASGRSGYGLSTGKAEFDALEFDRYTQLHLLSRDLSEGVSDIGAAGSQLTSIAGGFDGFLNTQGRLTSEIQEKLMRLRMVPLSTLTSRLDRTVRVTGQKRGKLATLALEGGRTEFDKTMLEQLAGPLEHLLRNAVDHGVEDPSVRVALGKPEAGEIQLRASYEGTEVVLRLSDDGCGIDPGKIAAAAVRQGFITTAEVSMMSPEQIQELLFVPGFSTAAELSDISGRGVGLDTVKSAVENLKGALHLDSGPGRGTTFTIRLPMSLAITRVLMVRAHQQTYALPLLSVAQAMRVLPSQMERIGQKPILRAEKRVWPLIRLSEVLRLGTNSVAGEEHVPIVIVRLGQEEFALAVDEILEARQIVVKTLNGFLRKIPAIAGATILGDGSVILLLNPAELSGENRAATRVTTPVVWRPAASVRQAYDVLIVDDSLSVRRVVANLIRNAGWNPQQAKDGIEALEVLKGSESKPDVILMDIEMPRMDGFELTARLRSMAEYAHVPIIMLTSRAGDKHRGKAIALGVTEYLVKPYQDEVLLGLIRKRVEEARQTEQVA